MFKIWMGCHDNRVPTCVLVSMLLMPKLSGYLLSLLLASVLFLAGSESLSESEIFLLLRAEAQKQEIKASQRMLFNPEVAPTTKEIKTNILNLVTRSSHWLKNDIIVNAALCSITIKQKENNNFMH